MRAPAAKKLPTVRISDGKNGFVIINESDYDLEMHKLYEPDDEPDDEPKILSASLVAMYPWDKLKIYANSHGITGRAKEDVFKKLQEAGKLR